MKLKKIFACLVLSTMAITVNTIAGQTSYAPPERITCTLNNDNQLTCKQFNRDYLQEDITTADLVQGKEIPFTFSSAVAYFTTNKEEASVFFTFKNSTRTNLVKLRTTSNTMRPDLKNGAWNRFNDDVYTCTAGNMSCLITNKSE